MPLLNGSCVIFWKVFEFFFFAGLMYASIIVFTVFSFFYTYVDAVVFEDVKDTHDDTKHAYDNKGLVLDEPTPKVYALPLPLATIPEPNSDGSSGVIMSTRF